MRVTVAVLCVYLSVTKLVVVYTSPKYYWVLLSCFQIPDPFPIPTFRARTEANLSQRKLADDDRKYMVRVLGTLLCTYVQRPTMKNCRTVTASLVCKYAFLKEAVSEIFIWRVIFVGSNFRGKSIKINFHDSKFRDSNQSRGVALLHKLWCNRYKRSRSSLLQSHTYRDLNKRHEIERILVPKTLSADDSGYCCLLTLESVGRAATMFVAMAITMDSYIYVVP